MADITIYHNGECSKCRGALELLQEASIPHHVRFYIAEPLSREELKSLLAKLGIPAQALLRKDEPLFKDRFENSSLSENEWIEVLIQHPGLMQRPVVSKGDKAIIARPPEKVMEFLQ